MYLNDAATGTAKETAVGVTLEELHSIATALVEHSGGRITIGKETEQTPDDNTFVRLDGKNVGRSIEMYNFMGSKIKGWEVTVPQIWEEVIFPIKKECPDSYKAASELLSDLGDRLYESEMAQQFREIITQ